MSLCSYPHQTLNSILIFISVESDAEFSTWQIVNKYLFSGWMTQSSHQEQLWRLHTAQLQRHHSGRLEHCWCWLRLHCITQCQDSDKWQTLLMCPIYNPSSALSLFLELGHINLWVEENKEENFSVCTVLKCTVHLLPYFQNTENEMKFQLSKEESS